MIKVQDLTKIYKSRNRTNCIALDHVSFTLPDNGMVFVLGKSGSGKSTLLNLLGGLDGFEFGEIYFEDERLSKFTKYDFYDYRCRHIGFVFQDFHLLEELTVEENIALVLDLESAEHGDLITNALQKVGLEQYASRYPRELSGGQKQRVAMARAIVKNPEVILCDEPTGNLDADNSRQILNLLKEFSKTKLVIIVSHNIPDAENYADRILELRDGQIIRDEVRREGYTNAFDINEEGTLTLPYNKTLSTEQIENMVEGIRAGEVKKVVQNDDGFQKVGKLEFRGRPYSRRNSGMSLKKTLFLTRTMMRGKFMRFLVAAITATLIVSCFAVFQSFLNYDINTSISRHMVEKDFSVIAYQKATLQSNSGLLNADSLVYINQEDLEAFGNTKYGDRLAVLYDHTLPVLSDQYMNTYISKKTHREPSQMAKDFYVYETYGVLACTPEYLANAFGNGEAPEVLAGDINQPNRGIIITDYIADGIMKGNPTRYRNYEEIIGAYHSSNGYVYGKIDAIIKTDYEEKYGDLKERILQMSKNGDEDGLKALRDSEEFLLFAEKLELTYGLGYTFSKDYVADISTSTDFGVLSYAGKANITLNGVDCPTGFYPQIADESVCSTDLGSGEVILGLSFYNDILHNMGQSKIEAKDFEPTQITITYCSRGTGEKLGSRTYTIVALTTSMYTTGMYMNTEDYLDARQFTVHPYAIYVDDASAANVFNNVASERNFVIKNVETPMATKLDRLIITFADLFRLFEAFLLAICVIYLCAFGSNVIQRHKYQVGIIKSLGGKTIQIASIFLAQPLVVGAFIIALSGFGIWGATAAANAILLNSMQTHMELEIHLFNIIEFYPHLAIIDLVLVVLLTMISALAPVWAIHNIKPINIIKAKE